MWFSFEMFLIEPFHFALLVWKINNINFFPLGKLILTLYQNRIELELNLNRPEMLGLFYQILPECLLVLPTVVTSSWLYHLVG
jgi:hypothetical protein